jgi:hypothetical protein
MVPHVLRRGSVPWIFKGSFQYSPLVRNGYRPLDEQLKHTKRPFEQRKDHSHDTYVCH